MKRVFIFIHHFAGPGDPLTTAMRNEALAQGIRLHLRWARRGYVDAYHTMQVPMFYIFKT